MYEVAYTFAQGSPNVQRRRNLLQKRRVTKRTRNESRVCYTNALSLGALCVRFVTRRSSSSTVFLAQGQRDGLRQWDTRSGLVGPSRPN